MQTQEADGWSLINPKGVGKRMVVDRQKVKTSSEFRRYRRAGRRNGQVGGLGVQKTSKIQNRED